MAALDLAEQCLATNQISKDFLTKLVEKDFLTEDAVSEILDDAGLPSTFSMGRKRRTPLRNPKSRRRIAAMRSTIPKSVRAVSGARSVELDSRMSSAHGIFQMESLCARCTLVKLTRMITGGLVL